MDEARLSNGLPKHRSYYGDLIKSGKLGGQARKPSTKSEESPDTDRNPFISVLSSPGVEASNESRDRSKTKNYAMRSKSLQDLKNVQRETGRGRNENGMNSDYLQSLYDRYPHTFHKKKSQDLRRPSRHMFNSRLHVHFDDEVHYNDDVRSISSERGNSMKWDREMERILGQHCHPRSCLTSPTPSLILDPVERPSKYSGATSLPRSFSHVLRNGQMWEEFCGEEYSQSRILGGRHSGDTNSPDRIKLLELELERKEKQLQSYRRRLEFQQPQGSTFLDSINWRVFSPDSPPDSAIDLDSSSVQSSNFGPSHMSPRNNYILQDTAQGSQDSLLLERRISSVEGGQHQDTTITHVYNKDSDVDSGIAQSLTQMRSNGSDRILHKGMSTRHSYHLPHRPVSAMEIGHHKYTPDTVGFAGMWSKVGSNSSRRRDSDEDSIIQEIHQPILSGYQFRSVHQQEEEELDDSDPTLGLPTIAEDDLFVREVYQQRKKPTPYKIVQRCLTARAHSAPTWKNCVSGSHVSVLCTPRREEKPINFSPVDPRETREARTESVSAFKSQSESSLHQRPGAVALDADVFRFNPKLEQKIRRHSRKLSQSSDSDQSEKTLISSQIALNTDSGNQLISKHHQQEMIPTSKDSNSLETLSLTDEVSSSSGLTDPEIKVHWQRDLKETDLNKHHIGHHKGNGYFSLTGPERLTPYEASVIKMDSQGLDVEDMIESDSDNVFAKPLTLIKVPKLEKREGNVKGQSEENVSPNHVIVSRESSSSLPESGNMQPRSGHVTVSRESSTSLPESVNTEPRSGSPDLSLESENIPGMEALAAHCFTAGPGMKETEDMFDSQVSDYATVDCSDEENDIHALPISVDQKQERVEGIPDSSHPIYAKVKRVNRKLELGDTEAEKRMLGCPTQRTGTLDNRTDSLSSTRTECGSMLSREVSQSTPNVAGSSTYKSNQDVPPLPDRNYGSTTNLSKSKELSGSRISLSNKMSNFKAAAKSKFKTLRKAVSLDKGINKTQGEFRPEALEVAPKVTPDLPSQGKPPKPKKGRSLKKFFARRSSKHRSTDSYGQGGEEAMNPETVGGQCSSIESKTSDDETAVSQLKEVLMDGTQIVELNRRHKGPIGFYIARGSTQFKHGIFVSRFSEEADTDERFVGLLNIGDEILEVNGHQISDASLDDVYDLMADQTLEVKILPLLSRKDIHDQHS